MPLSGLDPDTAKKVADMLSTGGISAFGGAAFYLYRIYKGQQFRLSVFLINLFLAFFIGYVVGRFFPDTLSPDIRDGVIAVSGFLTFPILDFLEKKGLLLLLARAGISADDLSSNSSKNGRSE